MSELQTRLNKLMLRLDYMGMRVEQAVLDAVQAAIKGDLQAGLAVSRADPAIDREEVEIEQECIRLLALHQPAAIDLRTICTIIKVNSDLERIADLAASMGKRVKHIVADDVSLETYDGFEELVQATRDILGRTVRGLGACDLGAANDVIKADQRIDDAYKRLVQSVLAREDRRAGGAAAVMTVITLAKSFERIGDHCTNIAEDIVFLRTGEIVRHPDAFKDGAAAT